MRSRCCHIIDATGNILHYLPMDSTISAVRHTIAAIGQQMTWSTWNSEYAKDHSKGQSSRAGEVLSIVLASFQTQWSQFGQVHVHFVRCIVARCYGEDRSGSNACGCNGKLPGTSLICTGIESYCSCMWNDGWLCQNIKSL